MSSTVDQTPRTTGKSVDELTHQGPVADTNGADTNGDVDPAGNAESAEGPIIVGVGASAGGLSALKEFFKALPGDCGVAVVVVVHLSPDHESQLAELLQPHVAMPVQQVHETTRLEPNRVYVIPPASHLEAIDSHLRLTDRGTGHDRRSPIDHFFKTLAATHDGNSIGVVLTGTGSDGTLGLREVKQRGGLAIVQDPNEAEYDGMPQSAVASGVVDLVLPVAEIPNAILRFANIRPRVPALPDDTDRETSDAGNLQKIFTILRTRTGRDFTHYKRSTILRRVARRMQFCSIEEIGEYARMLQCDRDELARLADDLLINVTNFFRDREVFDHLAEKVIPALFANRKDNKPIRVWSVGCATGEEAYTLAMLLLEHASGLDNPPPFQVFASDLHDPSLQRAREGFYLGNIRDDVGDDRLMRFFDQESGGYRIRKEVREIVVFAPHNVLSDPPFSRLDLVVCRNLLIYLNRDVQPDIVQLFHYALKPGGLLLLGIAETLDKGHLFDVEDKSTCLYRKRGVPASEPQLPVFPLQRTPAVAPALWGQEPVGQQEGYGVLHHRMVEKCAPPSVLINEKSRIVHVSSHAGRYLTHPGGEMTTNLLKLVREELRPEIRGIISEARESGAPAISIPVPLRLEGKIVPVVMSARPATEPEHAGFLLVIFDEHVAFTTVEEDSDDADVADSGSDHRAKIRKLVVDLDLSRQRMQSVVEDYEAGQEELKSSNEELQSTNEELRSTLEELETSKEELQSMNEELQTVNEENRHKVEELSQLSSDLQNLLSATDIATLFLDRDLRILRFTPKVGELFNVRMTDRGRPLTELTYRLGYPELQDDARRVLQNLIPIEREAQDEHGSWYLSRMLPYRDAGDRIVGVVITCIDITGRKHAELALRSSEERFRIATEAVNGVIYEHDLQSGRVQWSSGLPKVSGYQLDEAPVLFQWWLDHVHPDDRQLFDLNTTAVGKIDREYRIRHKDGHWVRLWDQALLTPDEEGAPLKAIGCAVDVTTQREFEESLKKTREIAEAANRSRGEFLANMSHEIRTPMAAILGYADVLTDHLEDPDNRHAVGTIKRNGMHLLEVINDILDLSRIEAGKFEIEHEECDFFALLADVRSLMSIRVDPDRIQFKIESDGPVPTRVRTDLTRLKQILLNLIGNALKFTEEGSVVVKVSVLDEGNASSLCIAVQDTGIGIDNSQLVELFQPFLQADASVTRQYGGSGLGLTISKRLTELLGGRLTAESRLGEGSTFTVVLPASTFQDLPRAELQVSHKRKNEIGPRRMSALACSILLVDDRHDVRHIAQHFLEEAGATVATAEDGQQAIDAIVNATETGSPYDLVFMDMQMPNIDGYTAVRTLRERGFCVPIVALTASAMRGDRERCMEVGCNEYLTKPLDPEQLTAIAAQLTAR